MEPWFQRSLHEGQRHRDRGEHGRDAPNFIIRVVLCFVPVEAHRGCDAQ